MEPEHEWLDLKTKADLFCQPVFDIPAKEHIHSTSSMLMVSTRKHGENSCKVCSFSGGYQPWVGVISNQLQESCVPQPYDNTPSTPAKYCWWQPEIRLQKPPVGCFWDKLPFPQLVFSPDFWLPSTVWNPLMARWSRFFCRCVFEGCVLVHHLRKMNDFQADHDGFPKPWDPWDWYICLHLP